MSVLIALDFGILMLMEVADGGGPTLGASFGFSSAGMLGEIAVLTIGATAWTVFSLSAFGFGVSACPATTLVFYPDLRQLLCY